MGKKEVLIGDGEHTIKEWAVFHVDSCYEASSDFDRDCMIKCVEVGYDAYKLNLESKSVALSDGWIKCKNGDLPEPYLKVFVSDGECVSQGYYKDGLGWVAKIDSDTITHWMNLPNPPKP